jgi:hypothetical protein
MPGEAAGAGGNRFPKYYGKRRSYYVSATPRLAFAGFDGFPLRILNSVFSSPRRHQSDSRSCFTEPWQIKRAQPDGAELRQTTALEP